MSPLTEGDRLPLALWSCKDFESGVGNAGNELKEGAMKKAKKAKAKKAKAKKKVTIKDLKPKKSERDVKGGGGAYGGVLSSMQ
jgi:hypothetical protein